MMLKRGKQQKDEELEEAEETEAQVRKVKRMTMLWRNKIILAVGKSFQENRGYRWRSGDGLGVLVLETVSYRM